MSSVSYEEVPGPALALLLLVFSIGAFYQSYDIAGFSSVSSAGAVPLFASSIMVLSSLVILFKSLRSGQQLTAENRWRERLRVILPWRVLLMVALISAYLYAMPRLGFLLSSGVFLFASLSLLWRRGVVKIGAVTVLSLVVINIVFRTLFQVVLPQGSWLMGWF